VVLDTQSEQAAEMYAKLGMKLMLKEEITVEGRPPFTSWQFSSE